MSAANSTNRDRARRDGALRFLLGRVDFEQMRKMPYGPDDLKLDRMRQLLDRLGSPQQRLRVIHVAGTKGKGSTTATIAAILTSAGYRVGTFTSPHLDSVEERIAVDGRPCTPAEFGELVERVRPVVEAMDREVAAREAAELGPTFFEVVTAMAFLHFVRQAVDAVVLEVGLGGRLDSTNVCLPCVSVISSISLDHTQQLGDTLESIAREKAGIIKPGIPVISGVTEAGPRQVIRQVCAALACRLIERGTDFNFVYRPPQHVERAPASGRLDFHWRQGGRMLVYEGFALRLLGQHQAANAAVALATITQLQQNGWQVAEEAIRAGLAEVTWPARVEVVGRRPVVVLDAAHNAASAEALVRTLDESFTAARRYLVFATTEGKDVGGMLGCLLGRFDEVLFTRYRENPRAVPPAELATLAESLCGRKFVVYSGPAEALAAVFAQAGPEDLICITGSFYLAAEARRWLAQRSQPVPAEIGAMEST